MNKGIRYSPELKERAVRLVLEHQFAYSSQWAPPLPLRLN